MKSIIRFFSTMAVMLLFVSSYGQLPDVPQKYRLLEKQAPAEIKQKVLNLRKLGIQKKWTFQVGVTSVAKFIGRDVHTITGAIPPESIEVPKSRAMGAPPEAGTSLGINASASKMDLRTKHYVSPVRNQGGCGSCWAFCAAAAMETAHIIKNKVNPSSIDLSEQFILSCSGAGSCGGGQPRKVYEYFINQNKGCPAESTFSYQASDLACPTSPAYSNYKIDSWGWVGNKEWPSVSEIKNALAQYGAVSTYIWVNSAFGAYVSGVINDDSRTGWGGWHCVQIVGWDDSKQAFLIKNSWGSNWGMNGFGWVRYDVLAIRRWSAWVKAKPLPRVNGYYSCNDGGHYYIRQIGKFVYWFGEHPSGNWANVFKGTVNGNTITGQFYDVPKGKFKGSGQLVLKMENGGKKIVKLSGPHFGGSRWTKKRRPSKLPGWRTAGFSNSGQLNNLTGSWSGNDGGRYYLRQKGNLIIWFGEKKPNKNGIPAFANVAIGTRSGNKIRLAWADVPKCNLKGKGQLILKVNNANSISKVSGSGFGGTKWTRGKKPISINGSWVNIDKNTGGITRLIIGRSQVHAFGKCHPKDCDWGKTRLSPARNSYKAVFNDRAAKRYLSLQLQKNGTLKVTAKYDYKDSRKTRKFTYYFRKSN